MFQEGSMRHRHWLRDVFSWHPGAARWRLSFPASVSLSLFVLANVCFAAGLAASYWLQPHEDDWQKDVVEGSQVFHALVPGGVALGYVYVSSKAPRPPQLHLNGAALLALLPCNNLFVLSVRLHSQGNCAAGYATRVPNLILWGFFKGVILLVIWQRILTLGSHTLCCVQAHRWGYAVLVSVMMLSVPTAMLHTLGAALVLNGLSCEEALLAQSGDTLGEGVHPAVTVSLYLFLSIITSGIVGLLIGVIVTMFLAGRMRRDALAKLVERQVTGEELAKVQRNLGHHVLGMFASLASTFLVVTSAVLDSLQLLGKESQEAFTHTWVTNIDIVGDTAGILLLSGLGILLFHEDPEAGDVSGRIWSILHSAVLTSQAEMAFEGRVDSAVRSGLCVASFPGKFFGDWHALTWACEQGEVSSACVFLPKADPQCRFGQHAENAETPGECWCHSLYGEEKPWGCCWFTAWMSNVERAAELALELVVVFFPGQAGRGILDWGELGHTNLWDGNGLGGSQKAEVAYLRFRNFRYTEMDLETFRRRVHRMSVR